MEIEARVRKIIVEQLDVRPEEVTADSNFTEDLGVDSLDSIELLMKFEEEFGFEISDEDAERMKKVKDVLNYLERKLSG